MDTPIPPFDLGNPNPEPWQFTNELHRKPAKLVDLRTALESLRDKYPAAYQDFVATLRSRLCA